MERIADVGIDVFFQLLTCGGFVDADLFFTS